METYRSEIASDNLVELIHLSQDRDEDAATDWATEVGMPWPTLLTEDTDEDDLILPYFPDGRFGVPSYLLVDRTGKEITRGKSNVFNKLEELRGE